MGKLADSILGDSDSTSRMDETTTGMDIAPVLATVPRQPRLSKPKRIKLRRRVSRMSEGEDANDENQDGAEQDSDLIPDDADKVGSTGVDDKEQDQAGLPPVESVPIHASYAVIAPDFTPGAREKVDVSKIKPSDKKSAEAKPAEAKPAEANPKLAPEPREPDQGNEDKALNTLLSVKTEAVRALSGMGIEAPSNLDEAQVASMARTSALMRVFS